MRVPPGRVPAPLKLGPPQCRRPPAHPTAPLASSRASWEEIEPRTETSLCEDPRAGDRRVRMERCWQQLKAALCLVV